MPRISAATVSEHVAQQEAAVIAAARHLFHTKGVREVSLADIAAEVGLSRTALYRYFPTKAHIVQRWFDLTMELLITTSQDAVTAPGTPIERFDRWVDVQLAFLGNDEHAALLRASQQSDDLPEDVRTDMEHQHRALYATLEPILLGPAHEDVALARTRGQLIAGLVRMAGDLVLGGTDEQLVRTELRGPTQVIAGLQSG